MKNLIFILAFVFAACSAPAQKENSSTSGKKVNEKLDVAAFQAKLKGSPGAMVIDVRTPEEFSEGNIQGAQNIDFNAPDFEKKISALDKNKTYLLYCKAGVRSAKAASKMSELGFTSLYSLDGGYVAWKEKGN